jgi:hypothetical protein
VKLHCPSCGSPIDADDMNVVNLVAKCRACDDVFSFAGVVETPANATRMAPTRLANPAPKQGEMLPRPPGMIEQQLGNTWTVTWRWFTSDVIGLLVFAVAWDAFLVFWYSMAFGTRGPWIAKVFPIGHVAVGVCITYYVLTGLFNRTRVDVSRSEVSVRHYPLPWLGNRSIASADLTQLFCEQAAMKQNGIGRFRLCATLRSGNKITLLSGFRNVGEAKYLERAIESRLNIAPTAVVGEYGA